MIPQAHKKINLFCDYKPQLVLIFIDFENKKISIQHTVVTAKVNGTVTEIARDKTKTKSSCRTLPLIPACEQMLNKMKKEQEQNRKVCGKSYCTDYLDYIYVDPMGKRIRPDFLSQHFPDFLVAHQMKRIRFHNLRHPYVKHTTKNKSLQKQKSQTIKQADSLGFALLLLLILKGAGCVELKSISVSVYPHMNNLSLVLSNCRIKQICVGG